MEKLPINESTELELVVRKFVSFARNNFLSACAFAFAKSKSNNNYAKVMKSIFPELNGLDYCEATVVFKNILEDIAKNPREHQTNFFNINKMILPSYFNRGDEIID